jgi:hypothetical protein
MITLTNEWIEEGVEKGIEQAKRQDILLILSERFDTVPVEVIHYVERVKDKDSLELLFKRAIRIQSPNKILPTQ